MRALRSSLARAVAAREVLIMMMRHVFLILFLSSRDDFENKTLFHLRPRSLREECCIFSQKVCARQIYKSQHIVTSNQCLYGDI